MDMLSCKHASIVAEAIVSNNYLTMCYKSKNGRGCMVHLTL